MRALTVDCVTNRRSAAFTKLPAATTAKKVRASSVSIDASADVSAHYRVGRSEHNTCSPQESVRARSPQTELNSRSTSGECHQSGEDREQDHRCDRHPEERIAVE